jgi:hypothetical protein
LNAVDQQRAALSLAQSCTHRNLSIQANDTVLVDKYISADPKVRLANAPALGIAGAVDTEQGTNGRDRSAAVEPARRLHHGIVQNRLYARLQEGCFTSRQQEGHTTGIMHM